jgi:DNA-binding MarR family transcriptional regulator
MEEASLPLDELIIVALRRISQAVETYSRFLLQEYGLTAPQIAALRAIERHGALAPGQLADQLHVSAQTVAGIVSRLEQRELIARERDERDRRAFRLTIRPEGGRLAATAPSLLSDHFRRELGKLQDWERTQLLASLQRIASLMNAAEVPVEPFLVHEAPPASDGTTAT